MGFSFKFNFFIVIFFSILKQNIKEAKCFKNQSEVLFTVEPAAGKYLRNIAYHRPH